MAPVKSMLILRVQCYIFTLNFENSFYAIIKKYHFRLRQRDLRDRL